MRKQGLLVRFEAAKGRDHELETFLVSALDAAAGSCFAVQFGRSEYGVFAFPSAVTSPGTELLASEARSETLAVLAHKLPKLPAPAPITRGLLLKFSAREGRQSELERFLRSACDVVEQEAGTAAWYALRLAGGGYALFAVFPDDAQRFTHLTGPVPRALTEQALALLDGVPDMDLLQVLAARLGS
ncbi:hypothetical protein LZ009_08370 [Ramlibacter sp. XY19]|uniref:putative quinol monooxygenase n=1 Tax=Ramlibacter paludis TaxID=2908000 RepID=UPI0023DACC1D|nr:hypothetical protein [Ramlibacter paludis]MCG2592797.1 hypothetical protein [Ramlibacter paludis]